MEMIQLSNDRIVNLNYVSRIETITINKLKNENRSQEFITFICNKLIDKTEFEKYGYTTKDWGHRVDKCWEENEFSNEVIGAFIYFPFPSGTNVTTSAERIVVTLDDYNKIINNLSLV
jgi:hypothetical protein